MAADNVVECLARLAGLVWQAESAGWRTLMKLGQLGGGEQAGVIDAGEEQKQLQPANDWGETGWERREMERMMIDRAGWAAGL